MTSTKLGANRPVSFPDAFILAALSGFAYLLGYAYERGFAAPLRIPPELIEVRWTVTFANLSTVLLAAVALSAVAAVPQPRGLSPGWNRVVRTLKSGLVAGLLMLMVMGVSRWKFLISVLTAIAVVLALAEALANVVATRFGWKPGHVPITPAESDGSVAILGIRLPMWAIIGALWMVLSVPVAAISGAIAATDKQDFLMVAGTTPQAVLRVYGDKMVTAEFDRRTETLHPTYHIIPVADSARVLTLERFPSGVPMCRQAGFHSGSPKPSSKLDPLWRLMALPEMRQGGERCRRYRLRRDSTVNRSR